MTDNQAPQSSTDSLSFARQIADQFRQFDSVKAVALAGSRAAGTNDANSDYDFYVYSEREIPLAFRRKLLGDGAEIDNRFWEPGDEASNTAANARIDIMYRSPRSIEGQLDRVLARHEAAIGYTTCFWFNVLHSRALLDREGWYEGLQQKTRQPYPDGLRRAIVAKNWPILRRNQSCYRHQIELALRRHDAFSIHHRVTALLASFFDIWFALERTPHPGEKRLLRHLPHPWPQRVANILRATHDNLLPSIDALLDPLDERLHTEKLIGDANQNGADDRT